MEQTTPTINPAQSDVPLVNEQPQLPEQQPELPVTNRYSKLYLPAAIATVVLLLVGVGGYYIGSINRQMDTTPSPTSAPVVQQQELPTTTSIPTSTPVTALISETNPTVIPTATTPPELDTAKYPAGWKSHTFPAVQVTLGAPPQWQSDFQTFTDTSSQLIRFWQGATADSATIQLDIKPDWKNSGDAQYLPRNFTINNGIQAAKQDPPKLEETKLDRYQTNYYFQTNQKVYMFTCVHNWIDEQYQLCETMLTTGSFY